MAADQIDEACENEQRHTEMAIQAALAAKPQMPKIGRCYNCSESISELFCDADCRDDWEKRQRRR